MADSQPEKTVSVEEVSFPSFLVPNTVIELIIYFLSTWQYPGKQFYLKSRQALGNLKRTVKMF